jgi:hypothetical protein
MKLHVCDIPDAAEELPRWLERHLVGTRLSELVAELAAIHGAARPKASLAETLGKDRSAVVERGLAALSPEQLRSLLCQPQLLLDLQDFVLSTGSRYWSNLLADEGAAAGIAKEARPRVVERAGGGTVDLAASRRGKIWYQHPLVVSMATAALLLVAVFVFVKPPATGPETAAAWGWQRPEARKVTASREQYLDGLADAANEWFNKQPADEQALAERIGQFRAGCSMLILADHKPLPEADRKWLLEKCQQWAGKIDGHLTALEAGGEVADVRGAMDETVRKLSTALRERAKQRVS